MKWDEMSARERDALVTEKLTGQCAHHLHAYQKDNQDWMDEYRHYRCRKCRQPFGGLAFHENDYVCPHYTTEISDAWRIVEKLRSADYGYRDWGDQVPYKHIRTTITDSMKGAKVCVETDGYSFKASAMTIPEAICKAALKALGVDIE